MVLSEHCGHVRGVAEAAVADGERTLDLLRRHRRRAVDWPASEIYDAFTEQLSLGAEGPKAFASQLRYYTPAVRDFGLALQALCLKMDLLREPPEPEQARNRSCELRALRDKEVRGLRDRLGKLDERFGDLQGDWLARMRPVVPPAALRYFRRRSGRRYDQFVDRGRRTEFVHPRGDTGATPLCGYCIWRCPHAPSGGGLGPLSPGSGQVRRAVPGGCQGAGERLRAVRFRSAERDAPGSGFDPCHARGNLYGSIGQAPAWYGRLAGLLGRVLMLRASRREDRKRVPQYSSP
ncbi:hypothetical protein ACWEO4_37690 [Streptomyces sp. NPDC004393]|uniref:hypothetical protein n=1 Tax=Streptomyces sp. NPDC004533 TaxID=3154278 RepID=UPI0033A4CEE2